METYTTHKETYKEDRLVLAGLLAISISSVITCISLKTLDVALTIAMYFFAASIPFLSFNIMLLTSELNYKKTIFPKYVKYSNIIGTLGGFLGIVCMFFHFSWIIGSIFIVMSATSLLFLGWFDNDIEKANKKPKTKPKTKTKT